MRRSLTTSQSLLQLGVERYILREPPVRGRPEVRGANKIPHGQRRPRFSRAKELERAGVAAVAKHASGGELWIDTGNQELAFENNIVLVAAGSGVPVPGQNARQSRDARPRTGGRRVRRWMAGVWAFARVGRVHHCGSSAASKVAAAS